MVHLLFIHLLQDAYAIMKILKILAKWLEISYSHFSVDEKLNAESEFLSQNESFSSCKWIEYE